MPENLACYLKARYDASTPHYVGARMWGPCCGLFNSGAAGFAVSRASLDLLAARWAALAAAGRRWVSRGGRVRRCARVCGAVPGGDAA